MIIKLLNGRKSALHESTFNVLHIQTDSLNKLRHDLNSVINEGADVELKVSDNIPMFATIINNISNGITSSNTKVIDVDAFDKLTIYIRGLIYMSSTVENGFIGQIYDAVSQVIVSFERNIYDGDSDDIKDQKEECIDRLRKELQMIYRKINNLDTLEESVFFLSHKDTNLIHESVSLDNVSYDLYQFFDEIDDDKLITNLNSLTHIIPKMIEDRHDDTLSSLLNFIYNRLILNVSALRKLANILDGILNGIDDDSLNNFVSILTGIMNRCKQRADENIKQCPNFKYNTIMELGLDDIQNNMPDDMLNNYSTSPFSMNESTQVLTEDAKEVISKITSAAKQFARKIDSNVNRILEDHREAEKSRMEDKIVKSTFAASYYLKQVLKGTALALIPEIGPAMALIYAVVKIATNARTQWKYKRQLLGDLQEELTITQEKIRDADNAGDNKAKYKLMRIQSQLQRAIDKIKYNIETTRSDGL